MNVAEPMAAVLFDTPNTIAHEGTVLPRWMLRSSVAQRMSVWVAVGILIAHAGLTNADALAALRGYAYSHSASLDDIADDLITHRLQPDALLP
jgi:hypothetical protein